MDATRMKVVWQVNERGARSHWKRIGVGLVNRDGSLALLLDAAPAGGRLQVRDYEARDADGMEVPDMSRTATPATVQP
jgi:hypothetical protein